MACNQCYPTNFENSNTKYKTSVKFSNGINEIIWALHVWTRYKHQLETFVGCISARQSYLCYFFFYEIALDDFIDWILE